MLGLIPPAREGRPPRRPARGAGSAGVGGRGDIAGPDRAQGAPRPSPSEGEPPAPPARSGAGGERFHSQPRADTGLRPAWPGGWASGGLCRDVGSPLSRLGRSCPSFRRSKRRGRAPMLPGASPPPEHPQEGPPGAPGGPGAGDLPRRGTSVCLPPLARRQEARDGASFGKLGEVDA